MIYISYNYNNQINNHIIGIPKAIHVLFLVIFILIMSEVITKVLYLYCSILSLKDFSILSICPPKTSFSNLPTSSLSTKPTVSEQMHSTTINSSLSPSDLSSIITHLPIFPLTTTTSNANLASSAGSSNSMPCFVLLKP